MKKDLHQITTIEGTIIRIMYPVLFFLMALSGFAQMPIFKRYYLADLPGLGWLAKYFVTHTMHYIGAMVLLFMVVYCGILYLGLLRKRYRLTILAKVKIVFLVAIVITGIFRVLKNLPDVLFSPGFTMFIDITHLIFMMGYLLVALATFLSGTRWLKEFADPV
ncbi:MAG: FeS-binding protein [Desulfobacteraceae bacterium]|jgi:hypothetical protein